MTFGYERGCFKCHRVFDILNSSGPLLLCLVLLGGCGTAPNQAPVQDRLTYSSKKVGYHIVSQGETLFSIAWRYGIDYRLLAQRNGISGGYTIYPGQKIELYKSVSKSTSETSKKSQAVASSSISEPTSTNSRSKSRTTSPQPGKSNYSLNQSLSWQWPATGKLVATFSSQNSLNKGVDIKGRMGESVVAAAPGVVVYAGDGIRGYGNLLIIKHNETYLSAYAHNHRLLVKEQAVVKGGEKIAEIGRTGTDSSKLHFEIRREGKPVDPLRYLPARRDG